MERKCPACGTAAESANARFCGNCGGRIPPPEGEVATVMERVSPAAAAPVRQGAAQGVPGDSEAMEFTALCPSCGAANPPDSAICEFCGEEIPIDQRRRRTAVFGVLGASGGAGVAGGILASEGSGALGGMARAGEGMQGLGQGGGMSGLGQSAPEAMSGLGQSGAMPGMAGNAPGAGMGASGPSNLATPPSPGGSPAAMGSGGAPSAPPYTPASPGGGPLPADPPPMSPPNGGGGLPQGPLGSGGPPAVAQPAPPMPPVPPASPPSIPYPGPGAITGGGSKVGGVIIKTILGGIGIIGGVVIGGVVLGGILVFTGDPKPCVDRSSTASNAAVTALFARWNQFTADAQAGPATVTFNEEEATSRAQQYLNEKDIPLDNAQVYFCPSGRGQVKGRVSALGRDINILLEGRVDTTQQPPVIVVDEIKAGNLPSSVAEAIVGDRLDKNGVKVLDFGIPISAVNVVDGNVTLESPGP